MFADVGVLIEKTGIEVAQLTVRSFLGDCDYKLLIVASAVMKVQTVCPSGFDEC